VRKVLELFNLPEKEKEITIDTINQNDNPFFQLTTSEVLHWETMDRS